MRPVVFLLFLHHVDVEAGFRFLLDGLEVSVDLMLGLLAKSLPDKQILNKKHKVNISKTTFTHSNTNTLFKSGGPCRSQGYKVTQHPPTLTQADIFSGPFTQIQVTNVTAVNTVHVF